MSFIKLLNSEKNGFALVTVLILLLISLTLVTVLITISISEFRQAERNKNNTKAYFLAHSAAKVTAEAIKNEEIDAKEENYTIRENGKIISTVGVDKDTADPDNYIITAQSEVNNVQKTVILELLFKEGAFFDSAVYFLNGLKLENGTISGGDISTSLPADFSDSTKYGSTYDGSYVTVSDDFNKLGPIKYDVDKELNTPEIPTGLSNKGKLEISGSHTISSSGKYEEIKVEGGSLTFQIDSDQDIEIVVNGEFKVEGGGQVIVKTLGGVDYDGRVIVYTKKFKAETSGGVNVIDNQTEDASKFILFGTSENAGHSGAGPTDIMIETDGDFYGGIYAKSSTVKMETSGKMLGAVIADGFIKENTASKLEYAPIDTSGIGGISNVTGSYELGNWSD